MGWTQTFGCIYCVSSFPFLSYSVPLVFCFSSPFPSLLYRFLLLQIPLSSQTLFFFRAHPLHSPLDITPNYSFHNSYTTSGIIPHSARPPSRNFTGARLSFAVKLSTNEWTGRIKASQEELRHFTGALAMLHILKHQVLNGNDGDRQGISQP